MMTTIVLLALGLSMLLYLFIGARYSKAVHGVGDVLPMFFGKAAKVKDHREFGASTVATTISLATVIIAFFELVPGLGLWLLWPAITTAMGLALFGLLVKRIWDKMGTYDHRPTLHEYIGTEFNSKPAALIASVFTTIGYLTAFAVELTVGSRFLSAMLPDIPQWITVVVICAVSFIYTGLGGFRTVVVTDRIQMWFIWLLLFALLGYYAVFATEHGWSESINKIPEQLRGLHWNSGLIAFVWGILIMNLFLFISNMGLWQRIAGAQDPSVVVRGMRSSVFQAGLSWSLFAIAGVATFMLVSPVEGENLIVTVLKSMQGSPLGLFVIFCVVLGLYGAMLSTASTQLIATSHTIYEDIIAPFRRKGLLERSGLKIEVFWSRVILVASAIGAVGVVELLRVAGFSVADLAFAIYGAALGLVPPILMTLFMDRAVTRRLSLPAILAVAGGFISCWAAAGYGKSIGDGNLVFLSPVISTVVATVIMFVGWLFVRKSA